MQGSCRRLASAMTHEEEEERCCFIHIILLIFFYSLSISSAIRVDITVLVSNLANEMHCNQCAGA